MSLGQQLLWGGFFMGLCLLLETAFLVWATSILRLAAIRLEKSSLVVGVGAMMFLALAFILMAHTAQVLLWSVVWIKYHALTGWNEAIYFSLVTYTTVGYGDVTLGPGLRVFGTFASVAGVLGFGISSAFLIALMSRMLQDRMFGAGKD